MKIIDGIKLIGSPAEIPDCGRDDLPQFFVDMGFKVGAEIGVLRGEFTEKLCQTGLKVYAVDPWKNYLDYHRHPREESYDEMLEITKKRLAPYDCTIVRKTSMEAVEGFKANSLDFVYIDGNHKLRHVIDDIYEWSLRVRSGGVICGHDYELNNRSPQSHYACHVVPAVHLYTKMWDIPNWFILGEYRPAPGQKRDKHRSWMWIKP
jgi:hypothetical protein